VGEAEAEPMLTAAEAAARLRVSPATVRRWVRQGKLRGTSLWKRGRVLVPLSEVERLLREGGLED
jgi:excisionase family DNA binding protein